MASHFSLAISNSKTFRPEDDARGLMLIVSRSFALVRRAKEKATLATDVTKFESLGTLGPKTIVTPRLRPLLELSVIPKM